MSSIDANFKSQIFRFDQPNVIAMNRASAMLIPIRLRWQSGGYTAGTLLARNSTDGVYQAYNNAGSSGTDTAVCILFEHHPGEDFDGTAATSTTAAVGIAGGCAVYKSRLTGYDTPSLTDLGGRLVISATGDELLKF